MAKVKLTQQEKKEVKQVRDNWMEELKLQYGSEKVDSWMSDPVKLRIINTLSYMSTQSK